MIIPPITLYEEDQALLEILKALGKKAAALANYTTADADKIQYMVNILESQRSPSLTPDEIGDIVRSSSSSLAATNLMQIMLHSNLQQALEQLNADPLYQLIPLPAGKSCTISARGQGRVSNKHDSFYLGRAKLMETKLSSKGADPLCAYIKYRVELNGQFEEMEAMTSDLRLAFVGPVGHRTNPSRPNIACVTGYGIAKKSISSDECTRGVVWFALTLWDYGGRKKQGRFRIAVYNPQNPSFNHDSGIVAQ